MKKILFVCLGNICRSSTAEGVMLHLIKEAGLEKEFVIDSAGILSYHHLTSSLKKYVFYN